MFVESRTGSGLVAMTEASDHRSVAAELRRFDPDLRLVPQTDELGRVAWRVYRYQGSERPAAFVCGWWDETTLEPWPLSHALVDRVKRLSVNTRSNLPDPDKHNERLSESRRRSNDDVIDTIAQESAKRIRRSPALHRGVHLRRSRHGRGGRPGGRITD